ATETPRGQDKAADTQQVGPIVDAHAPVLQRTQLLLAGVLQHPHVPTVVGGIDISAQRVQPCRRVAPEYSPGALVDTLTTGAIYPIRRDSGSGVDAHPSSPVLPEFGPCMGIAVAHHIQAVYLIE